MNNIFKFVFIIFFTFSCGSKTSRNDGAAIMTISKKNNEVSQIVGITFDELVINLGKIKRNIKYHVEIGYMNTMKSKLVITNICTSCGCTIAIWNKKPLKPDENSEIKVNYSTHQIGFFSNTINVYSNAKNSPVQLIIKGVVTP